MDASAVAGCFRDKTILLTGSTGFLGKCAVFVEKILRVQPDVKKIYLLVRAPDAKSAEQRIQSQVLDKDVFNTLREKHGLAGFQQLIKEKIFPLAGDIGDHNFGLDNSRLDSLCEEIDVIINGAATTNFHERYDVALASNVLGAKYGCEIARKCPSLKLFLHVSTAFVAGTQEGLLLEKAFQMGETLRPGYHLDIEAELRLAEKVKTEVTTANSGGSAQLKRTMKELGLKRACHFGWPNTYTFSKAMGEMLLEQHRADLPVVIIRPTMVTSTYQQPFPGWIEGARTFDAMIVAYNKQAMPCFIGDRRNRWDAVPADMVVNATLVSMAVHWNETGRYIYHVSSGLQNPLIAGVFESAVMEYFSIHPLTLANGKALQNRTVYLFKKVAYFHAYSILMYKLPLEMLRAVNLIFCGLFTQHYNKFNRRYTFLMLLVRLYAPYAYFKGCFDDTNLTRLSMEVRMDCDDGAINFDPKSIDWRSYLLDVHIPAVLKYGRKNNGIM